MIDTAGRPPGSCPKLAPGAPAWTAVDAGAGTSGRDPAAAITFARVVGRDTQLRPRTQPPVADTPTQWRAPGRAGA
jgi:hypothetical protein